MLTYTKNELFGEPEKGVVGDSPTIWLAGMKGKNDVQNVKLEAVNDVPKIKKYFKLLILKNSNH